MTTQKSEAEKKGRVYFIGHRDLGVLMVHEGNQGLKVNIISKDVIDAYALKESILPDSVFGILANVLSYVSTVIDARRPVDLTNPNEVKSAKAIGQAVASNVLGRVQVSNVDFCFATEIPEGDFGMGRFSVGTDPIGNILAAFESTASNNLGAITSDEFDK
ncbi:hypothetical protein [Mesorhizobium sp. M0058]|uniref:hypothetical protein n=1 Tax=Mesorhizobium sp. M0058 TaxID=2956865 RepID=UPI003336E9A8